MFFNAVKEGDLVMFACDDEQDRILWVQAVYRATGQSYKPVPQNKTTNCRGGNQKPASPISRFRFSHLLYYNADSKEVVMLRKIYIITECSDLKICSQ